MFLVKQHSFCKIREYCNLEMENNVFSTQIIMNFVNNVCSHIADFKLYSGHPYDCVIMAHKLKGSMPAPMYRE